MRRHLNYSFNIQQKKKKKGARDSFPSANIQCSGNTDEGRCAECSNYTNLKPYWIGLKGELF